MRNSVFLGLVVVLFTHGPASAQGRGDYLILTLKNGQRVVTALADIRKLTFDTVANNSGVQPERTENSLLANYPNPFTASTKIQFDLSESGSATLTICAATGNVVRTLKVLQGLRGRNEVKWDGSSDSGTSVPVGTYYCEVRSRNARTMRKIVLLK